MTHKYAGKFIVFEGCDGAGTTTLSKMLAYAVEQEEVNTWWTKEPCDGEPTGKLIRSVLRGEVSVRPRELGMLYVADRVGHNVQIADLLSNDVCVISDRYAGSTYAYQTSFSNEELDLLCFSPTFALRPDVIVLVDTPIELIMHRLRERKDCDIFETRSKQEEVIRRYDQFAKHADDYGLSVIRVRADRDPVSTFEELKRKLDALLDSPIRSTLARLEE